MCPLTFPVLSCQPWEQPCPALAKLFRIKQEVCVTKTLYTADVQRQGILQQTCSARRQWWPNPALLHNREVCEDRRSLDAASRNHSSSQSDSRSRYLFHRFYRKTSCPSKFGKTALKIRYLFLYVNLARWATTPNSIYTLSPSSIWEIRALHPLKFEGIQNQVRNLFFR